MAKPITITFREGELGTVSIESDPPMGELAKKIAGGYQLTLAEAFFANAMFHIKKVAKEKRLIVGSRK